MNRAARRAARFTKAGRHEHAEATRHICEHGNWMKTDGNGDPMCPHRCGFRPEDRTNERHRQAIAYARTTRHHGPVTAELNPTPGDPPPPPQAPPMA